ncbi:MAG: DNA polymerase III subunit beta [Gammaproteobacteria bacterium]|nr:DNA polymerase III subunit beta [Gammaproteobacteria bacterium]
MIISTTKEQIIKPLQMVVGVVERRQSLPILGNVLISARNGRVELTTTDLEVELFGRFEAQVEEEGETTFPARKILDICKALPDKARLHIEVKEGKGIISSGKSRFRLTTMNPSEFPTAEDKESRYLLKVGREKLKRLIEKTQFAMAHQDVRFYLNGLLLESKEGRLKAVATDGHRLAISEMDINDEEADGGEIQAIVPRKAVLELSKVIGEGDEQIVMELGRQTLRVDLGDKRITSKLVDGKYPDYEGVIPRTERCDKKAIIEREVLRDSLARASILSNEKYRAVRIGFDEDKGMRVTAHNMEQEEAVEELEAEFEGEAIEIGFNVGYLMDAISAVDTARVIIYLINSDSSSLIVGEAGEEKYVVMPMRL